jgi:hypothetical protein
MYVIQEYFARSLGNRRAVRGTRCSAHRLSPIKHITFYVKVVTGRLQLADCSWQSVNKAISDEMIYENIS